MFIEKRWRYGEYSADKTLPIEDCELQYKRCYKRKSSIFKSKRYSLGKGDSAFFKNLKDTLKLISFIEKMFIKLNRIMIVFQRLEILFYTLPNSRNKFQNTASASIY